MVRPDVIPTSPDQVRAWAERQLPDLERVAPDVWAIPVPVDNPIRYTFAYLVAGPHDAVVIDPGPDSPEAAAAWDAAFAAIGIAPHRLRGIVVTHFHFDHWEGAGQLAAKTGAWVALGAAETDWVQGLTDHQVGEHSATARFTAWGVPAAEARVLAQTEDYGHARRYFQPDHHLLHGQTLPLAGEDIQVLHTPGHTPGHVCLHDRRRNLLFSGDHLLPTISSHVALNPFGYSDPLMQYLESLVMLRHLEDAEVLPAHQYRFAGVHRRVEELEQEVAARLSEVRRLLHADGGATIWELAQRLSWSRPWTEFNALSRRMAVGEAAAFVAHVRSASGDEGLTGTR
ncbi:MBL fold metallo-hydrolase [Intrasporangium calvum]|uniref:MBL fold metallo-hydrolase n=1 Tax=Intrasporangium calvum TaxID=53358 RepID=A0ABT5GEG7_9MICO|nr:MBL fold metallo-hydrolase [Intrasporangium calvum]MDC5696519.1 MBL fold metallo-hydrolase [Intrasporangium calvum]